MSQLSTTTATASSSDTSAGAIILQSHIQAAASAERNPILTLFAVIFASARAAVRCLAAQFNDNPRQRTFETYHRLRYCLSRIPAILYTLHNAPERFLKPAQLRALIRCRAVLAHIWRQGVDFSPLIPYLTAPENCPSPPRSSRCAGILPASEAPLDAPRSALNSSEAPHSALRPSPDPLLLHAPGRALAAVLHQLAAIYGLSAACVPVTRPVTPKASSASAPSAASAPAAPSQPQGECSIDSALPSAAFHSPHSDLPAPHSSDPPP